MNLIKDELKVGIVADWFITYAGSEKVVSEFLKVFPNADLYSVVDFLSADNRRKFNDKKIETTFIQKLPRAKKKYQAYLPLMPFAIEQLDVSKQNIVLSSSHAVSKGILTGPDQLHISYVHSPIRYAWDLQHQYLRESGLDHGLKGILAKWILHKMRMWDYRTANGVDHFIANSHFIARRIKKVYGRDADVIYPPVDVDSFTLNNQKEDFYLTASRMVPYKRIDLIVEAFSHLPNKKLVVIGDGPEMNKIKKKATSNIEILGYQPNEVMVDYMRKAKAFVFAAEEEFGITPVEAQACGTPVIAFGKGGALETVKGLDSESPTGIFFGVQDVKSIINSINEFERYGDKITAENCRENSELFSESRFRKEFEAYVMEKWTAFENEKRISK